MNVIVIREGGVYRVVTADPARTEIGWFLTYAGLISFLPGLPRKAPTVDCEIARMKLGANHRLLDTGRPEWSGT